MRVFPFKFYGYKKHFSVMWEEKGLLILSVAVGGLQCSLIHTYNTYSTLTLTFIAIKWYQESF